MFRFFILKENSEVAKRAEAFLQRAKEADEAAEITAKELFKIETENLWVRQSPFMINYSIIGFEPKEMPNPIPKQFKQDSEQDHILIPNRRTKVGRELAQKLSELPNISYRETYETLELKHEEGLGRFYVPKIMKIKDVLIAQVDGADAKKTKLSTNPDFEETTMSYLERLQNGE